MPHLEGAWRPQVVTPQKIKGVGCWPAPGSCAASASVQSRSARVSNQVRGQAYQVKPSQGSVTVSRFVQYAPTLTQRDMAKQPAPLNQSRDVVSLHKSGAVVGSDAGGNTRAMERVELPWAAIVAGALVALLGG